MTTLILCHCCLFSLFIFFAVRFAVNNLLFFNKLQLPWCLLTFIYYTNMYSVLSPHLGLCSCVCDDGSASLSHNEAVCFVLRKQQRDCMNQSVWLARLLLLLFPSTDGHSSICAKPCLLSSALSH